MRLTRLHFLLVDPVSFRPQVVRGRSLTWTQQVPVHVKHDEGIELGRLRVELGLDPGALSQRLRAARIEARARDLVDFEWGVVRLAPEDWARLVSAVRAMQSPEATAAAG